MPHHVLRLLVATIVLLTTNAGFTAPRDVQIRSINIADGLIELHNFGGETEMLDGWRFCSHDQQQIRVYTNGSGLNGRQLSPGDSLFVHLTNDAPDETGHINASVLGAGIAFAGVLDTGPYGLQLFFPPTIFENGNQIADHLQWSVAGQDNGIADERSDEAEAGNVWTDQSAWISTAQETFYILLTDATGAELHGPSDYLTFIPGDANGDGAVDLDDFSLLKTNFGTSGDITQGDLNVDGSIDLSDFNQLKINFGHVASVPEPSSLLLAVDSILMLIGIVCMAQFSERKRHKDAA